MIWMTANSSTTCHLVREARCCEEKDYAMLLPPSISRAYCILPRLERKRESAKFVQ